jgi:hypothetical protein
MHEIGLDAYVLAFHCKNCLCRDVTLLARTMKLERTHKEMLTTTLSVLQSIVLQQCKNRCYLRLNRLLTLSAQSEVLPAAA